MLRVEVLLLVLSGFVWTLSLGVVLGFFPLAGLITLDLYRFYSIAAVLGWLSGNVYMLRRRTLGKGEAGLAVRHPRRMLVTAYVLGPPSVVMLIWALSPSSLQQAAPFVPVYALAMFGLFFLVPVTFGGGRRPRRPGE